MHGIIAYALLGIVSSFHIGNSLTVDSLGNQIGNTQVGTFGIEAIAKSYGHNDYVMSMHAAGTHRRLCLHSIWDNPDGVGGVDVMRNAYGNYTNALLNYHWSHVILSPTFLKVRRSGPTNRQWRTSSTLTRQNPDNLDTIFYVYQVLPQQSFGNLSDYWSGSSPDFDSTPGLRPAGSITTILWTGRMRFIRRKAFSSARNSVGEVWNRVNLMIESGEITGITTADLYRDNIHSSYSLGRYLDAVANYAVLFKTDVRGLVPPAQFTQFDTTYSQSLYDKLNEVIWEVVSGDSDFTGIADLNDDGYVSQADLAILQAAYGVGTAGDTNGDGKTDGRDFLNWQRNYSDGQHSGAI